MATAVRAQLPSEFPCRRINAHGLSPGQRSAPLRGHVAGDPGGTNSAAVPDWSPGRRRSFRRPSHPHGGGGRIGGQGGFGRLCLLPAQLPILPPAHAEPGVGILGSHHYPGAGSTSLQGDGHHGTAPVRTVRYPVRRWRGKN